MKKIISYIQKLLLATALAVLASQASATVILTVEGEVSAPVDVKLAGTNVSDDDFFRAALQINEAAGGSDGFYPNALEAITLS